MLFRQGCGTTCFIATLLVSVTATAQNAERTGDSVRTIADVPYANTDEPRQTLDLYLPKTAASDEPLPLIAFIHGGGWRNGDKSRGRSFVLPFVERGHYAAASIGYRLTDSAQWPEQIYDCKAAIRWLRAHAEEYGYDPDRIGVMGTSAGGHLVAMLGVSGDVEDLEGSLGEYPNVSSRVQCVVDFFGPTNFPALADRGKRAQPRRQNKPQRSNQSDNAGQARRQRGGQSDANSAIRLLLGGPIADVPDRARNASPVTWVSEDDAPTLIIHGTADPLVPLPQSIMLRNKLREAGVPVALITIQDGKHGRFQIRRLDRIIAQFFGRHLHDRPAEIEDTTLQIDK